MDRDPPQLKGGRVALLTSAATTSLRNTGKRSRHSLVVLPHQVRRQRCWRSAPSRALILAPAWHPAPRYSHLKLRQKIDWLVAAGNRHRKWQRTPSPRDSQIFAQGKRNQEGLADRWFIGSAVSASLRSVGERPGFLLINALIAAVHSVGVYELAGTNLVTGPKNGLGALPADVLLF